jgi:hypothetical protein
MTSTPVIPCRRTGLSGGIPQWSFWCPHCCAYHHHGGQPDQTGEIGHRVAHCHVPTSPFRATGYILVNGRRAGALAEGEPR